MAFGDDEELPPESGPSDDYGDDEADFRAAVAEAFPAEEWDDSRLAALKEAIKICTQGDTAKPGLAVMLGAMSKKKG